MAAVIGLVVLNQVPGIVELTGIAAVVVGVAVRQPEPGTA